MHFRTIILLLVTCLLTYNAQAQKKKPNKDVEVINFGDSESTSKENKVYHGLILKTSPVSFIFGRQPIELEKELKDYMSLQAGVGVTFEPLWAGYEDLVNEINDEVDGYYESDQWAIDEPDVYSDYSIRKGKPGFLVSLSPRLFFESDGFEGMYIAPVLRYSAQNYEVQKVQEGLPYIQRIDDVQKEHVKNFDLLVHYGGQNLYPKLTFEWFIGGGIRFRNNLRQDVGYDGFQASGNGEREFKDKKFRLEAGIRVGFQL